MELKEVLAEVPGLSRRFVYYLEARGHIHPARIWKRRIARREYTQEDLRVIREVWRYYQRGYSLQSAFDMATAREQVVTYLGIQVPSRDSAAVLERLQAYPQVVEASAVYGTDVNVLVRTETPDASEVYHTLAPLLVEMGITGLPAISVAWQRFQRQGGGGFAQEERAMMAYVLMRVPGKDVDGVMEQLRALDPVVEASTVYGESDIIAKVQVAGEEELDALVMQRIHGIPAVESTRTFVVIGRLHWSR